MFAGSDAFSIRTWWKQVFLMTPTIVAYFWNKIAIILLSFFESQIPKKLQKAGETKLQKLWGHLWIWKREEFQSFFFFKKPRFPQKLQPQGKEVFEMASWIEAGFTYAAEIHEVILLLLNTQEITCHCNFSWKKYFSNSFTYTLARSLGYSLDSYFSLFPFYSDFGEKWEFHLLQDFL